MLRRLAAVATAVAALLGTGSAPAHATSPTFHLISADGFNTATKLGSFRDCDHNDGSRAAYCGA